MEPNFTWINGPDDLIPSDSLIATRLDQTVNLRLGDVDSKKYPPISIYCMLEKTVNSRPNYPALDQSGTKLNYSEYWSHLHRVAKSFIKLGLNTCECVGIIGFNSMEWFLSLVGAIFAGGVGCGIYTTNSAEICEHILRDSGAQIVVVENDKQLDKIIKCKENGVPIKKIIMYDGIVENNYDGLVIHFKDFLNLGNDVGDEVLKSRIKTLAPNRCASLIYTSGTTGNPKAAMISHDNLCYTVRYIGELSNLIPFNEKIISYLPLAHIAAQILDIFVPMYFGSTVYFAKPDALKGSLNKTMKEVRPTYFFGVPRVWEKIQENILKETKSLIGIKLNMFEWARRIATENVHNNFNGSKKTSISFKLAKSLILNAVLQKLGLDQCRNFYSGAAPITKETLDFFISLGIPLCEVYGLSESTGPHNIGFQLQNRITSIGPLRNFNKSKIMNQTEDGSGELGIYGRHVFMGYLNEEIKSKEVIDEEGWFRSGDLAKIEDGFIFITGRLKELIITAGGENVAPVPIEDSIKAELPDLISNCMLIGDKRKFLTVLITLKTVINLDTMEPTDLLTDTCIEYLKDLGTNINKPSEIVRTKDPIVYKTIENAINRVNERSVSRASKVQKFAILVRDFSLANGELGPTLKLRRSVVTNMYAKTIDDLYCQETLSE